MDGVTVDLARSRISRSSAVLPTGISRSPIVEVCRKIVGAHGVRAVGRAPARTGCAPGGPSSSGSGSARRPRRRRRAARRARPATAAGRGRRRWSRARSGAARSPSAARDRRGSPTQQPQHVRVRRPGRGRRRRRRSASTVIAGCGAVRRGVLGEQRRAGRACTARASPGPAYDGTPRSSSATAGGGTGITPCAPRTVPRADRHRRDDQLVEPEVREPGADPDDVGDRVERADLVEVHLLGAGAVHRGLGDAPAARSVACARAADRRRAGRRPRAARGRRAQVRCGACCRRPSTWQRVAARPCRVTCSGAQRDVLGRRPRRPRRPSTVERHPGVDQRAEQHVAAGAGRSVDPADHAVVPRRGAACAGHPGGEHAGAEAVVDVARRSRPGAQELSIAEQRGQPAERGAVADAGRHRDQRHADRARRPRWAARPPCRRRRPGSRRSTSSSRTASTRCSPATPTSVDHARPRRRTPGRSSAASAATGASEVPADTTATVPRGAGSGPRVTARATGSRTASGQRGERPRRRPRRRAGWRARPGPGAPRAAARRISTTCCGVLPAP